MTDENGNLSIDFLAGFTIFILAFIWVVSMIPGLMIGLQSYTIDYDAVAYRTGVILAEDPGYPVSPPWESYIDQQKFNVTRFGLAISKDTPNILSEDKVNRFFSSAFIYPIDYRTRAIFGDYPYGFNFSLIDMDGKSRTVGDVLPDGYGYIRRLVKVKGASNATIDNASYVAYPLSYIANDNASTHVFSILIDNPRLLGDVTDPAYQIDPSREQITINIMDLPSTITYGTSSVVLKNIKVYKREGESYSPVPLLVSDFPFIDGSATRTSVMPYPVTDNVTLKFNPRFFNLMKPQNSQIYIALGFDVSPPDTFLNNTQALPDFDNLDANLTFNNLNTIPFNYNYDSNNVTQPKLMDAVLEVAVWSGTATESIGGPLIPVNLSHTIYATTVSGGTISPIGTVTVIHGADQTFAITNNSHYHITDVVIDGVSGGAISSYTFVNVTEDHTIAASFAIDTYNITASAGANGTISPSGTVFVNYGANQLFTITPDTGYHITDVVVDGVSNGTISSYTFTNVMVNHTISATYAINTYVITPTTPLVNGAINPNTPQTVNYGDTPTFTFTPDPGYHLDTVLVDGNPLPPTTLTTFTFPAVSSNQTISATFAINAYTITASTGANGAISPSGAVPANFGDTPTFTITPNAGYHIADVLVDGVSIGGGASYTFPAVTTDHTIAASFAANAPVTYFSDDFEAGFSGWTTTGDVLRDTSSVPKNGTASIRLRQTGSIQRAISTAGYSSIRVTFAMAANSLDSAAENVYAEWNDGSTWSILKQITYNGGENDNTLRNYNYSLPAGADHNPNFQLRFRISGSGTGDYGYVDDVYVTGIPD